MKDYVIGLIFNEQADRIVLTRKDRPAKLSGKMNGIGGKINPNEDVCAAVSREVHEETGLILPPQVWHKCAELVDDISHVHVLRTFTPLARLARQQPGESERIFIWRPEDSCIALRGLPDLRQMIDHARDRSKTSVLRLGTSVRLVA